MDKHSIRSNIQPMAHGAELLATDELTIVFC